jgi:UDP-N-acetylglucosamine acyltransferase
MPPLPKLKEPLSYVGINSVGLRRRGFSTDKIREIQDIYRILYQKITILPSARNHWSRDGSNPERRNYRLIRNSSRGVMKGYTKKLLE